MNVHHPFCRQRRIRMWVAAVLAALNLAMAGAQFAIGHPVKAGACLLAAGLVAAAARSYRRQLGPCWRGVSPADASATENAAAHAGPTGH